MARTRSGPDLTQAFLDSFAPPEEGRAYLRDQDVRGLVLVVTSTGNRSWFYEFRSPITLKNARIQIVAKTLNEARRLARAHKGAVVSDRDPVLEKKETLIEKRKAHMRISVKDALDAYEEFFVQGPKARSRRDRLKAIRHVFDLDAGKKWLAEPAAALDRGVVVTLLDAVQKDAAKSPRSKNGGATTRRNAHAYLRAWQQWLLDRNHVSTISLAGVKKPKAKKRERALSDAELHAIWWATTDGSAFSDIVRVLLHTGMRRDEAATLKPRDLDFDAMTLTIRDVVDKTEKTRVIALPAALAPMLKGRAQGLEREQYIFGEGSAFERPYSGWSRRMSVLRAAMPPGDHWQLHDLRHTVSTRLNKSLKVDWRVVEELLGHAKQGIRGNYDHAEYPDEVREALAHWEVALQEIADGPESAPRRQASNVVPLRRPA